MQRRAFTAPECLATTVGLILLTVFVPIPVDAQTLPAEQPLAEELVVVESSILLQRAARTTVDNLEVAIDSSLAEAVAVYPLAEVGFPTTVHFDLCAPSFSRLTHAVGMIAAIGEQIFAGGVVSVVASDATGARVLLAASQDTTAFEAALTQVLRTPLGGCDHPAPLAAIGRMRRALDQLDRPSTAPSLLILYGFDHQALTADELRRYQAQFTDAGRRLAGEGRTTVVLMPDEGDSTLRQEEVRPLLGDPDGPPRTIDLEAFFATLFHRKQVVPADSRVIAVATDPRNELVRELIAPGHGRLFAFPRQIEAFARELSGYQVLFYRSRLREADREGDLATIQVRTRSGEILQTAEVTSRARTTLAPAD